MNRFSSVLGLCAALFVASCGGGQGVAEPEPLVDLSDGPPNIIILALDTWRADHMGAYGNTEGFTPALDAFAAEAIVFEDCASTSTWTLPSFASMYTGLLPSEHRTIGGDHSRLPEPVVPLAERLQAHGFRTSALAAVEYLDEPFGLERGFEKHWSYATWPVNGRLRKYKRMVQTTVSQPPARPWMMLVHYFDAHDPYEPQDQFDRMYYEGDPSLEPEDPARSIDVIYSDRNRIQMDPRERYAWLDGVRDIEFPVRQYAGGISYVDHHIGDALDAMRTNGRFEDSIVVVVADHGEHLVEHDVYFTHRLPYSECLHVPLMIRLPGGRGAGMRISSPVSLVDVMPTLMELIGAPVEDELTGRSLVPLMRGEEMPPRLLFAEYGARKESWAKSVWDDEWRYTEIFVDSVLTRELFDRRADGLEENDLSAARPDLVELYSAALDLQFGVERRLVQDPDAGVAPVELDPAVVERLRALGYVDGGGR